jgi:hypothetical protein
MIVVPPDSLPPVVPSEDPPSGSTHTVSITFAPQSFPDEVVSEAEAVSGSDPLAEPDALDPDPDPDPGPPDAVVGPSVCGPGPGDIPSVASAPSPSSVCGPQPTTSVDDSPITPHKRRPRRPTTRSNIIHLNPKISCSHGPFGP